MAIKHIIGAVIINLFSEKKKDVKMIEETNKINNITKLRTNQFFFCIIHLLNNINAIISYLFFLFKQKDFTMKHLRFKVKSLVVPLTGLEPVRSLNRGILRQTAVKITIFGKVERSAKTGQNRTKNN